MSTQTLNTKAIALLVRANVLTRTQVDRVVWLMDATNERSEDVLIDYDVMNESDLLKALAAGRRGARRVPGHAGCAASETHRRHADPDRESLVDEVRTASGMSVVKAFVARPAAVRAAIRRHHKI